MNLIIQTIVEKLEALIIKAYQSGNKYDFTDPAHDLCNELEALENRAEAIEPLFLLIERSPAIDYGGPGPLGAFLESFEGGLYETRLLESLHRKPTLCTISLLDILLQDYNDPRQALYLDTMREIAVNSSLPEEIRDVAMENIQYALENLYPLNDASVKSFSAVEQLLKEVEKEKSSRFPKEEQQIPPVSGVIYGGIFFRLVTWDESAAYLPNITDIPGLSTLYDIRDEWRFPSWHENAYFLLAEEDAAAENFQFDYSIDSLPDITVLGFIFLKDLKLDTYLMAFDTDNSPAIIIHGDLECPNIHLFGNIHYIGGKVTSRLIWTKYNHGELYLNGSVDAKVILADDMPVFIRDMIRIPALVSRIGMNIYLKGNDEEWLQQPSTHSLEDVFFPELCEESYGEIILLEEGSDTALIRIMQNKPILK